MNDTLDVYREAGIRPQDITALVEENEHLRREISIRRASLEGITAVGFMISGVALLTCGGAELVPAVAIVGGLVMGLFGAFKLSSKQL